MSSGYNESGLSEKTSEVHRASASLQEELEAIDYYDQRADRTGDADLKAVLLHNRNEEIEHASMLLEWLRRRVPEFNGALSTYLFKEAPITEIEASQGGGNESRGLGIGKLA